jgi:uncharacterized protein (TIGR03086 family)
MPDLRAATGQLATLVSRVDDTQLDAPTPCPEYTIADLLDHIARLTVAFGEAGRKERATNTSPPVPGSRTNLVADWRTRIPADADMLADAWADDDAWDGTTVIAGMEMPASVVGAVGCNEVVVHGWDLARAIGWPFDVDDDIIATCMAFVGPMSEPRAEAQRAPAFGPVVAPPADASPLERLIALNGRDPAWTPPS